MRVANNLEEHQLALSKILELRAKLHQQQQQLSDRPGIKRFVVPAQIHAHQPQLQQHHQRPVNQYHESIARNVIPTATTNSPNLNHHHPAPLANVLQQPQHQRHQQQPHSNSKPFRNDTKNDLCIGNHDRHSDGAMSITAARSHQPVIEVDSQPSYPTKAEQQPILIDSMDSADDSSSHNRDILDIDDDFEIIVPQVSRKRLSEPRTGEGMFWGDIAICKKVMRVSSHYTFVMFRVCRVVFFL
jgi:hypothetical protein